jgi:hypothetical protein
MVYIYIDTHSAFILRNFLEYFVIFDLAIFFVYKWKFIKNIMNLLKALDKAKVETTRIKLFCSV